MEIIKVGDIVKTNELFKYTLKESVEGEVQKIVIKHNISKYIISPKIETFIVSQININLYNSIRKEFNEKASYILTILDAKTKELRNLHVD